MLLNLYFHSQRINLQSPYERKKMYNYIQLLANNIGKVFKFLIHTMFKKKTDVSKNEI